MRTVIITLISLSIGTILVIGLQAEPGKVYEKEAPKWRALGKACMGKTPFQTYKDCRAYCDDITSSSTLYHYCLEGIIQ